MSDLTLGDSALSAWRPWPGMIWVQTREPKFARKLADRADSKLVGVSFRSPYLRIFAFEGKNMSWAERLIKRYQAALNEAGAPEILENGLESAQPDTDAPPPHLDDV